MTSSDQHFDINSTKFPSGNDIHINAIDSVIRSNYQASAKTNILGINKVNTSISNNNLLSDFGLELVRHENQNVDYSTSLRHISSDNRTSYKSCFFTEDSNTPPHLLGLENGTYTSLKKTYKKRTGLCKIGTSTYGGIIRTIGSVACRDVVRNYFYRKLIIHGAMRSHDIATALCILILGVSKLKINPIYNDLDDDLCLKYNLSNNSIGKLLDDNINNTDFKDEIIRIYNDHFLPTISVLYNYYSYNNGNIPPTFYGDIDDLMHIKDSPFITHHNKLVYDVYSLISKYIGVDGLNKIVQKYTKHRSDMFLSDGFVFFVDTVYDAKRVMYSIGEINQNDVESFRLWMLDSGYGFYHTIDVSDNKVDASKDNVVRVGEPIDISLINKHIISKTYESAMDAKLSDLRYEIQNLEDQFKDFQCRLNSNAEQRMRIKNEKSIVESSKLEDNMISNEFLSDIVAKYRLIDSAEFVYIEDTDNRFQRNGDFFMSGNSDSSIGGNLHKNLYLYLKTTEIKATNSNTNRKHILGRYELYFGVKPGLKSISIGFAGFKNIDRNVSRGSGSSRFQHPHALHSHICLGGFSEISIIDGDIENVINRTLMYLQSVNPNDDYGTSIYHFPEIADYRYEGYSNVDGKRVKKGCAQLIKDNMPSPIDFKNDPLKYVETFDELGIKLNTYAKKLIANAQEKLDIEKQKSVDETPEICNSDQDNDDNSNTQKVA